MISTSAFKDRPWDHQLVAGYNQSLWDEKDEFFKDLVVGPDGQSRHTDVFSWVGLIPLFVAEVIDQRLLKKAPRFESMLRRHYKGTSEGHKVNPLPDPDIRARRAPFIAARTALWIDPQ
ncbi:MAG: hypothetical protein M3120_10600 [Pseudomonadota bacterium]|nr:hypothetical protein [Pseudomonadota bacterium]